MVLLEAALVVGIAAVVIYGTVMLLTRSSQDRRARGVGPGVFQVTHYDVKGDTRVVVQKLSPGGTNLLDEHVIATLPVDDPDYDAKFLAAMATARERRALFETEQE